MAASALKNSVKLYVYEITQGMARTMSQALIGRQLDGVWHTGVMVYGNEYFFGSGGITYCPPSGTVLGHPTEIVDLGDTEIPLDVFHEYLLELQDGRFRGDKYHLLNHNCNNFSNEVAQFLTGNSIPEKITNLPGEVMNTPLGQMMMPFIDQMMNQVNAGTHIGGNSQAAEATEPQNTSNSTENSQSSARQNTAANSNSAAAPEKKDGGKSDNLDLD